MDLVKKKIEININKKDYVMMFDMTSIATYKQLTNRSFSKGLGGLFNEDDEEIIYFIASTLRTKDEPNKPVGEEVVNGDTLFYLLNFKFKVIELVAMSLPSGDNNSKKK